MLSISSKMDVGLLSLISVNLRCFSISTVWKSARCQPQPPTHTPAQPTGRVRGRYDVHPPFSSPHKPSRYLPLRGLHAWGRLIARGRKASICGCQALSGQAQVLTAKVVPIWISLEAVVMLYQRHQQLFGDILVPQKLTQLGIRLHIRGNKVAQTRDRE